MGIMLGGSFFYGLFTGQGSRVFSAFLAGGGEAVTMGLSLMGTLGIFCGLMNIVSRAGGMDFLMRHMKRPLGYLLGDVPKEALAPATVNLAANMLGLGNAATPAGIKAAGILANGERAGAALSMFVVINTSSVQLIPSTVVALRAAHGAANPEAVILPGLFATALSTAVGIACCKWMEKRP